MIIYNGETIDTLDDKYFEKIFIIVNKDKRSIDEINNDPDVKVLDIGDLEISYKDIEKLPVCSIFKGRHKGIEDIYIIIKVDNNKCIYKTQLMPSEQYLDKVYVKDGDDWKLLSSEISIDDLDNVLAANNVEEQDMLMFTDSNDEPITHLIIGIDDSNGVFYVEDIDEEGYVIDSIDSFVADYQDRTDFLDKILSTVDLEVEEE